PATVSNSPRKSSHARAWGTRCFIAAQFACAAFSAGFFASTSDKTSFSNRMPCAPAFALSGSTPSIFPRPGAAALERLHTQPAHTLAHITNCLTEICIPRVHLEKRHWTTKRPDKAASGHTTDVRGRTSDQIGTVPLENRDWRRGKNWDGILWDSGR